MSKKLTQAEFLEKTVAVHGVGRYDYSQTVYSNNAGKVKIICKVHGAFEQRAFSHWNGQGCPTCGRKLMGPQAISAKDKLRKLREKHGNAYDYSQVPTEFLAADKIPVICAIHGVFPIKYCNHLRGGGCAKCQGYRLSRAEWLARFHAVHSAKFDYCLVPDIIQAIDRIRIICPIHGEFDQLVHSHVAGNGCRKCANANKLINPGGWSKSRWLRVAQGRLCKLYCIRLYNATEDFFKIGITSLSVKQRFAGKLGKQYELDSVFVYESADANEIWALEHLIKRQFKQLRYAPLHAFAGDRECYSAIDPILNELPILATLHSN